MAKPIFNFVRVGRLQAVPFQPKQARALCHIPPARGKNDIIASALICGSRRGVRNARCSIGTALGRLAGPLTIIERIEADITQLGL